MNHQWSVRGARLKIKIHEVEEERSAGGIIIAKPDVTKDDLEIGEIVEMGHLAYLNEDSPWANIGDVIMFQRYAGKPIREDKQLYRIINDIDVIAVKK